MDKVLQNCNVKSRLEKITDLRVYIQELGGLPKISSLDPEERKMATFLNNIKQARKKGKLKRDELTMLADIESDQKKTTAAFP